MLLSCQVRESGTRTPLPRFLASVHMVSLPSSDIAILLYRALKTFVCGKHFCMKSLPRLRARVPDRILGLLALSARFILQHGYTRLSLPHSTFLRISISTICGEERAEAPASQYAGCVQRGGPLRGRALRPGCSSGQAATANRRCSTDIKFYFEDGFPDFPTFRP